MEIFDERPPLEERIAEACKEVNLMRKGLLSEQNNWRNWIKELREEYKDELTDVALQHEED